MQWSFLSIKLHDYSLHPTVGLKATTAGLIPLPIHFWWCSEKREYFKISKISTKKKLQKSPFFSKTTVCSSEFATSTKTDSNKNVSGEFSEVFANLSRKDP